MDKNKCPFLTLQFTSWVLCVFFSHLTENNYYNYIYKYGLH
jgi:hypothetical protein